MWIGKKRFEAIERKIAALEEKQLQTNHLLANTNNSNMELLKIVKQLRKEIGLTGIVNVNHSFHH